MGKIRADVTQPDAVASVIKPFCPERAFVITNPTIRALHGERFLAALDSAGIDAVVAEIPDGEKFKTLGAAADGVTVPSQWEPAVQYKPQFGPTVAGFKKDFESKFSIGVDYHAASGYVQGLLLQKAIEEAGSVDPKKVAAKLDHMDVTTFFGPNKFATGPKDHGLQLAHKMVLAQWQTKDGKPVLEMVWPTEAATAKIVYPAR